MLGVQDFCGYYDWTFHHIRKHFGEDALLDLWANAIGIDSQRHYVNNGRRNGLKGLYDTWNKTGDDEKCDWTFTLDESRNVLRWDMRQCPSKGFLITNNLHTDEDYCDHCIGWVKSALGSIGMEMVHHAHNHCGQCWGEMRVKGRPYSSLNVDCDIRNDPNWNRGFLDEFIDQQKTVPHPLEVIKAWLGGRKLIVAVDGAPAPHSTNEALLMSAQAYLRFSASHCAVLIETPPMESTLHELSARLTNLTSADQPLLLYAYLPNWIAVPFVKMGLPRPLPILPMLIRAGIEGHDPLAPVPPTSEWMRRIAAAVLG